MVVHASCILGVGIWEIGCRSSVFLREEFFHFPSVGLDADREFEVFFCDGVPELNYVSDLGKTIFVRVCVTATYLINHHDSKQIANRSKEQPIQIMLDIVADGITKPVKKNLPYDEYQNTDNNVPKRPAVLQGICNKQ